MKACGPEIQFSTLFDVFRLGWILQVEGSIVASQNFRPVHVFCFWYLAMVLYKALLGSVLEI